MKRMVLVTMFLVLGLTAGCGSKPPVPAAMTEDVRREIQQRDAEIDQLESQQRQ
jgi:hypothetical protein